MHTSPALHQVAEGRGPRGGGDQEHLPLKHRQRIGGPAAGAAALLRPPHHPGLPIGDVSGGRGEDGGSLL